MSIINQKIRVLVVDDSMVARGMIMQGLSAHPRIEVIGYAINTMDAETKIAALRPDVVTMDVECLTHWTPARWTSSKNPRTMATGTFSSRR